MKALELLGTMSSPKRAMAISLIQYAIDNGKPYDIESDIRTLIVWESMNRIEQLAVEELIEKGASGRYKL